MAYPTDEIVGEFGYSFSIQVIDLPRYAEYDPAIIQRLDDIFYTAFPKINLTSEMAKREFLIAPILLEVARNADVKIHIEYPLEINEKLSGSLDYLLKSSQELIVIEAKKKDIDSGFNQLVAEMIALDQYEDNENSRFLYGAVTLGDLWKFGVLDRTEKRIMKNIQSHTVPDDIKDIFSILMGIVKKI
jgi:hypothetical protein